MTVTSQNEIKWKFYWVSGHDSDITTGEFCRTTPQKCGSYPERYIQTFSNLRDWKLPLWSKIIVNYWVIIVWCVSVVWNIQEAKQCFIRKCQIANTPDRGAGGYPVVLERTFYYFSWKLQMSCSDHYLKKNCSLLRQFCMFILLEIDTKFYQVANRLIVD